ncbi:MAG: DUF58 domain-containing protein, partial [Pseudomonadota bacterium]
MRPSTVTLVLVAVAAFLAFASALATLVQWPIEAYLRVLFWVYLGGLVAFLLLDALANRHPPDIELVRQLDSRLALGVAQTCRLSLSNLSQHTYYLWLNDRPPAALAMEGLPLALKLAPNQRIDVDYTVIPHARGPMRFDPAQIRVRSRWALWDFTHTLGEPGNTRVYPNFMPLFQSALNVDQLVGQWGIHIRQRRGEGTDFRQLRDFRDGDSLRQIDWRATARLHRPVSREYQDERDQQVVFLLDCGRRMRARDSQISHFDHALNAMLLSAFVSLRNGDAVGMLSFAGSERWLPANKGNGQLHNLLNQIYDLP